VPAPHTFSYAVVRVVPHVEREEFVNAGVVLFCDALDFLAAKVALDEARIRAIAPHVDLRLVRRHLDAVCLVCAGGPPAGPIGELPQRERWHWVVAPRSTILQTSPAHTGLCAHPDEELDRLMALLVLAPRHAENRSDG
jgi:Protein of unknown function (DUF3037)